MRDTIIEAESMAGKRMRTACAVLSVVLLLASGCQAAPTESDPDPWEEAALQYGELVVGKVVFACHSWTGNALVARPLTLDLFLARNSGSEPNTAPTAAQLDAIREVGGVVRHVYSVMAVRATIPGSALFALARDGTLNHARAVPREDRYDLPVTVGYVGDGSELIQRFRELGGHVDNVYDSIPAFHGVIPDSALPMLHTRKDVRYVQHDQIGCLS